MGGHADDAGEHAYAKYEYAFYADVNSDVISARHAGVDISPFKKHRFNH